MTEPNSLEHFGIKGMKWGVRRTPEELGHRKISKRNLKSGIYARSDSEDIKFPKGTKLYRMSYSDSDPQKGIYVTRNRMDRQHYKQSYAGSIMGIGEDNARNNLKERSYTTNEELRIPSWDKRKEVFSELAKDPKIRKAITEDFAVNFVKRNAMVKVSSLKDAKELLKDKNLSPELRKAIKVSIEGSSKFAKEQVKELDNKSPVMSARMMSQAIGGSERARNAYIDILKKQGYNATVDDYGRKGLWGTRGETSEALIIFDGGQLSTKSSKRVSLHDASKLTQKVKKTDITYDAKVLKNPQSAEQLKIYNSMATKRALATAGSVTVGSIVPGASLAFNALYNNAASKANVKMAALEQDKIKNWK